MAFNYRPKNAKELMTKIRTSKNKVNLTQLYETVQKLYSVSIILDPKSLTKIKIPRSVSESKNLTQVKQALLKQSKNKDLLKGVHVSFGDGSGTGKGTNAAVTAKQENATRLYCEVYNEKGKFPTNAATKKIYPEVDDDWFDTFEAQAKSITKFLNKKGYAFSRDKGIMPYLENIALKKCGVATKDSWNPADIYAVLKNKESEIKKDLDKIGNMTLEPRAKLDRLNKYMRGKIAKKELVGISLKKLSKGTVKTIELSNAKKKEPLDSIKLVANSIHLNLSLNKSNEFETGEMSMTLDVGGSLIAVQIRAFAGGVRESTQMDMTGKGAAAKLGKVSSREAIDPFLKKNAFKRRMGTSLPKVGEWKPADIKKFTNEWKKLKNTRIGNQKINWGNEDWEGTLMKAVKLEQDIDRTASQLSSKLQCFRWVEIFGELSKKGKLEEFLTVMYYGAKKEYASAGPFLKIA